MIFLLKIDIFLLYANNIRFLSKISKNCTMYMQKCQTFIFQRLFSEFDYLYYFQSYVVIKCCKRDETYCTIIASLSKSYDFMKVLNYR